MFVPTQAVSFVAQSAAAGLGLVLNVSLSALGFPAAGSSALSTLASLSTACLISCSLSASTAIATTSYLVLKGGGRVLGYAGDLVVQAAVQHSGRQRGQGAWAPGVVDTVDACQWVAVEELCVSGREDAPARLYALLHSRHSPRGAETALNAYLGAVLCARENGEGDAGLLHIPSLLDPAPMQPPPASPEAWLLVPYPSEGRPLATFFPRPKQIGL